MFLEAGVGWIPQTDTTLNNIDPQVRMLFSSHFALMPYDYVQEKISLKR